MKYFLFNFVSTLLQDFVWDIIKSSLSTDTEIGYGRLECCEFRILRFDYSLSKYRKYTMQACRVRLKKIIIIIK